MTADPQPQGRTLDNLLAYLRDSPWDKSRPEVGLPFEPTTNDDYSLWGRWVENLCLAFGCTFETAARVAALFVQGVRKERTSPTHGPPRGR
jgi:hypothetical protein